MRERIAILGAGIIGCLVGRELFRAKPDARVTLIERDLVGQGASQRSAGVHFPAGRNERVRAMAAFSEQYYASLLAERFDLPIYRLTLYALASRNAAGTLRRTLVSADEIEDPSSEGGSPISWPPGFTVWRIPGCQYSDVGALVRALARDLRGTTELLEGVIVEEISERGDGVSLSLSTGESVRFDKVVLAPGPWASSPACRALTKSLDIRVKKIVSLHLDLPLHDGSAAVLFLEDDAFLVPLRHRGHWLFSYTCTEWDVSPDQLPSGISESNLREARSTLGRYAPDLASMMGSGRVFCDAYAAAREPIVQVVGNGGNVVFAGAANGAGYRLAPAIAVEAVRLLSQNAI